MPDSPEQYKPPETKKESSYEFDPNSLINTEIVKEVKNAVQKDFPNSWDLSRYYEAPTEFVERLRQIFAGNQENLRQLEEMIAGVQKGETAERSYSDHWNPLPYVLKNYRGLVRMTQVESLCEIASCLKRTQLEKQDPITDIRKILQGKKILILGDDVGTLSEMLRFYGAESYGIDNDEYSLLVARSGLLSENGEPQNQVIKGNITELFRPEEGQLMQSLKKLGPFDVIFSKAMDDGFLLDEDLRKQSGWNMQVPEAYAQAFQGHCKQLNSHDGFQLYEAPEYLFFPKKYWQDDDRQFLMIPNGEE